ncbi:dolichyldiphosphatase [Ranunculus cassubicifolius]
MNALSYFVAPSLKSLLKPVSVLPLGSSPCSRSIKRLSVYEKNMIPTRKITTNIIRASATVRSYDEDGHGVMEKEGTLTNEYPKINSNLTSIGWESTVDRFSKWLLAILFGAFFIWKHDAESSWAAMGSVVNFCLSVALKYLLNQQRPVPTLRSNPGMPSSHAQIVFYAVSYVTLSMIRFRGLTMATMLFGAFILASGSYISWLRVSQKHHTISQVCVGAVTGAVFSIFWFQAWHACVLKAFDASLSVQYIVALGSVAFWTSLLLSIANATLKRILNPCKKQTLTHMSRE